MCQFFEELRKFSVWIQALVVLGLLTVIGLIATMLLILVIDNPTAGAGAIMGLLGVIQLVLTRRRRPNPPRAPYSGPQKN